MLLVMRGATLAAEAVTGWTWSHGPSAQPPSSPVPTSACPTPHLPQLPSPPAPLLQGNSKGDCYVYDSASGARLTHVAPVRISAPVRACGLSACGRHLLAAIGKGFVFRYEYCPGGAGDGSGSSDGESESGTGGSGGEEEEEEDGDDKENADSEQMEVGP